MLLKCPFYVLKSANNEKRKRLAHERQALPLPLPAKLRSVSVEATRRLPKMYRLLDSKAEEAARSRFLASEKA